MPQGISQSCKVLPGTEVSGEGLTGERSASKFTHVVVGRILILTDLWTPPVLCHVGLFKGQFATLQPAFFRISELKSKKEVLR